MVMDVDDFDDGDDEFSAKKEVKKEVKKKEGGKRKRRQVKKSKVEMDDKGYMGELGMQLRRLTTRQLPRTTGPTSRTLVARRPRPTHSLKRRRRRLLAGRPSLIPRPSRARARLLRVPPSLPLLPSPLLPQRDRPRRARWDRARLLGSSRRSRSGVVDPSLCMHIV